MLPVVLVMHVSSDDKPITKTLAFVVKSLAVCLVVFCEVGRVEWETMLESSI